MNQNYNNRLLGRSPIPSPIKSAHSTPKKTPIKVIYGDRMTSFRNENAAEELDQFINAEVPSFFNNENVDGSTRKKRPDKLERAIDNELFAETQQGHNQNAENNPDSVFPVHRRRNKLTHKQVLQSPSKLEFRANVGHNLSENTLEIMETYKSKRHICKTPYRVLDVPGLREDFYLNLVDWSLDNIVAVALGSAVYLWNATTHKVNRLCEINENLDTISSISWCNIQNNSRKLAIGTESGCVHVWDEETQRPEVTFPNRHKRRVGVLGWSCTGLLATGSRDRTVMLHDPRSPTQVSVVTGHTQEVCGLKWNGDGSQLATGGNDNKLVVWSHSGSGINDGGASSVLNPISEFTEHVSAVKAIAWSPHQRGLLCSGGGTADRCLRFWDTFTNKQINCVDTGSQVCNVTWSRTTNELVSSHGFAQNEILVWKYSSAIQSPPIGPPIAKLTGHPCRVLYQAISPDGQSLVTGAGDETLRFWRVFPANTASRQKKKNEMREELRLMR